MANQEQCFSWRQEKQLEAKLQGRALVGFFLRFPLMGQRARSESRPSGQLKIYWMRAKA